MRFNKHKWKESCVYKVRDVKKPYSGEFVCHRILVAVPNMDGVKPFRNEPAVSFSRKYLLFETLDIPEEELDRKLEKVLNELRARGFAKIEPVEEYETRQLELMKPHWNPSYGRNLEEDAA